MRLVATEYVSLDGVFEEPGQWSFPFFSEQAAQFKWRELQESDALLLGRRTYEGFAAAWPTMEGTGEHPLVLGTGAPLFADDLDRTVLTLTHHEVFDSGMVILEYAPGAAAHT
jgi:dihydrofolate reductase